MAALDGFIDDVLGGSPGDGDNVPCDCPSCGKESHFYVRRENGLGYCFACGYSVNLVRLLVDVRGMTPPAAYLEAQRLLGGFGRKPEREETGDLYRFLSKVLIDAKAFRKEEIVPVELPRYAVPISHRMAGGARRYLSRRGFDERHWAGYDLRYVVAPDGAGPKVFHHIVFPMYGEDGQCVFWTTRAAFEPRRGRKALNCRRPRRGILYGLSQAQAAGRDEVILVEGPLDVLALSGRAVGLIGRFLSATQAEVLARSFSSVVVCLDADARAATFELCTRLNRLVDARVCLLDRGDPADLASLGSERFFEEILRAAFLPGVAESLRGQAFREGLQTL